MESTEKTKSRSQSKTKIVGLSCLFVILTLIITGGVLTVLTQMEIIRDFETLNPDGLEGEALVVFRPGISLFQEDMTNAFVEGLVEKDWIVNITTSSSQTPINIHDYDLLVLGTPTYGGTPHHSIVSYLKNVGDLNGIDIILIITSGGSDQALDIMTSKVQNNNGTIIESLSLYTIKDNGGNARDLSYNSGKNLNL
ncbi:MAG: hypothetical protein BAJALOKI3v1_310040 [Promethearchaeota archaeon]|nr:MAG: hypothetical protein BAJALOKI3v1_310040 [Candidatus Lokiarchaeota archaeon]